MSSAIKYTYIVLVSALLIILQVSVFPHLQFLGNIPLLSIVIVVSLSVSGGIVAGSTSGIIVGVVMDILSSRTFGTHTLLYMVIGLLCGTFCRRFFERKKVVVLIFTLVTTFVVEFLTYIFSFYMFGNRQIFVALWHIILPETFYTAVLAVPCYVIITKEWWLKWV
ncbi:MAG: rod shape-determining protein MreD [Clostridiales bacterium]|jgi:rod shape-determining protein MreD|nr:rod shape-determining protein MreD [Clostridiales bacterium]